MDALLATRAWTPDPDSHPAEFDLRCCVAGRRHELRAAFRLTYVRYRQNGLLQPNRLGLRILPHQLLDTSWVLLATRGRRPLGTLSLIEDGAMGLPIESLYPVDVWRLRRRQVRVAELACFASLDGLGTQCVAVLRALLHSAIDLALRRQIEELVICVHPRQAPFYERRLGFQEFGPLRCCPWVCNQPAVAMRLSLMESNQASAAIALGNRGSEFRTTDLELTGLLPSDRAYFRGLLVETSPFARPDARPGRTAVAA